MPVVVAFVSQKGGVGKTTLARALASVAAHGGMSVAIADLDLRQQTATRWGTLRQKQEVEPVIAIEICTDIADALETFAHVDLLIVDCAGSAHRGTLDVVSNSHLVVLPTGASLDEPNRSALARTRRRRDSARATHDCAVSGAQQGRRRRRPDIY